MMNRNNNGQRGAAMMLAIMFLAMFALLGGALLSVASMEGTIADNYKTNTQSLYLVEAGIDQARENVRLSASTASQLLTTAAGGDAALSAATNLSTLLAADVPLINGTTLTDLAGQSQGTFHVFLRNDTAEGQTNLTDSNGILTLLSVSQYRNATRTLEVEVRQGGFPVPPAALTLDGPIGTFDAANSTIFNIDGYDNAASPLAAKNAVGTISAAATSTVVAEIQGPPNRSANYTGAGAFTPNVADVSTALDPLALTPTGLETMANNVASAATNTYNPAFNGSQSIGNIGTSASPVVAVVNGNCVFGPGTGYGILLVRGDLTFSGNFTWYGLILVIGQGVMNWNGGGNGNIQGAMFIAASRGLPRTAGNPLGPVLGSRGPIVANFNGGGGNGIFYNTDKIRDANRAFPYMPTWYRYWSQ